MSAARAKLSDRNLLLILATVMIVVLVGVSVLAHTTEDTDMRPSADNTGSAGAKAAFILLQELGVNTVRWDQPLAKLADTQAENATLLLLEPTFSMEQRKEDAAQLRKFMERGGRVLLTGEQWASLLPAGDAQAPGTFAPKLCFSTPEGPGELARVGEVEMRFGGEWKAKGPQFRVEQRCGDQPIVVRFPVGKGEAIWWTSSTPISNSGLKTANNLKLVLESIGAHRRVLFDEYVQNVHGGNEHLFEALPRWSLLAQFVAVFALLIFSFSRRKGPLRMPVELPRSSPIEFATSMGDLYRKAGASGAAIEAAKRRLIAMLQREAGLSRVAMESGTDTLSDNLQLRLGGSWSDLGDHLRQAEAARHEAIDVKSALVLVKAMREDEERVRNALQPSPKRTEASANAQSGEVVPLA